MGSRKLTLCASAVVAAALTPTVYVAASAPAAYATAPRSDAAAVSVTPAAPAAGSDIRLRAQGCAGSTGTAASAAFVSDARLTGSGGVLTGETRVRTSLSPGTYDVTVGCEGGQGQRQVKGTLTVTGQAEPLSTLSATQSLPAPASPVAPVHAGGGGTAHADGSGTHTVAVDARETGPGTRQAVIGLVLAGVAAVAVALRSASRGRDTSE
ncbi:hypothetical protein OHB41_18825 [Streptomyces sp. NBC_01571]|uniref:hypothetical protein n=1 Tax=Streptomyces sp. NBC_01571 TaxID=2975883 RepID=UPI0022500216|nr:hypothetical protein [Streptomyces sp. NBC_01571]MCX4575202.1 hypothetical protein [Streptomyces sp. NBC_01571]